MEISPLVGLSMPIWWALRDHVMGIDSPCIGHLLPVTAGFECPKFWMVSGQYREISWVSCFDVDVSCLYVVVSCLMVLWVLHYAASMQLSCCFCDTSCCFYDTSMILLVKEREKCHFCNALSISFITYYCKSEMRLWYFFREKISFVCKLLPIYEPFVSVPASKSSVRRPSQQVFRQASQPASLPSGVSASKSSVRRPSGFAIRC